jgi:rRNA-processing protein FCF1
VREQFRGYYRPTDDEAELMWREGLIVLDTNVLLNLYEYSEATRGALMRILSRVSDRVWLPYQVADEFQRNRLNRMSQAFAVRHKLRDELDDLRIRIKKYLDPVDDAIVRSLDEVRDYVDRRISMHRSVVGAEHGHEDDIRHDLDKILVGRVGERPGAEAVESMTEEALRRFEERVPPGFRDEGRPGDYLLWRQTMDHAKELGSPVVFVTDDRKEDWWYVHKGLTVGPRPELVSEFWSEVDKPIWFYNTESFLIAAKDRLGAEVSNDAVEDVRILEEDEERTRRRELMRARYREKQAERSLAQREQIAAHAEAIASRLTENQNAEFELMHTRSAELTRANDDQRPANGALLHDLEARLTMLAEERQHLKREMQAAHAELEQLDAKRTRNIAARQRREDVDEDETSFRMRRGFAT